MQTISEKITKQYLLELSKQLYGNVVKAVVDIEREVIAVGGDLHADEEAMLLEEGSKQKDLWGINIYPLKTGDDWIEFDSMINIRPGQDNYSRDVENAEKKKKIIEIVNKLIQ
jgi:hypothetical protein